jgi:hypothetical protein
MDFDSVENGLGQVGGDRGGGDVDQLADLQVEHDAAQSVGHLRGHTEAVDDELHGAADDAFAGFARVGVALDEQVPGLGAVARGREALRRVDGVGAGEGFGGGFVKFEGVGGVHGGFHAVDAHFAVALRRVAVAGEHAATGGENGEEEPRARREVAHVEIAAKGSGRTGAKLANLGALQADDAGEGVEIEGDAGEAAGLVALEFPDEEMGVGEFAREQAEAGDEAGPGEAVVGVGLDYDFEGVAGLGAVDGDGAGEGVDLERVELGGEVGGGPIGFHLPAGGVGAAEGDGVAGGDGEARRGGVVPAVAERLGGEDVVHGRGG